MPKLRSIMDAADQITVGTIAQPAYCGGHSAPSVAEVYAYAKRQGFDWVPLRDADKKIYKMVAVMSMQNLATWGEVEDQATLITLDQIVARDAPMFSILDRLERKKLLFCLGREGIDGVVTIYDVNQPAAHYFGFAIALVIEAEIKRAIDDEVNSRELDDTRLAEEARAAGIQDQVLKQWLRRKLQSEHLSLTTGLSFRAKLQLLKHLGATRLAARCSAQYVGSDASERILQDLHEVVAMRNDVAHDTTALTDHAVMYRRLRLAYNLAHLLGGAGIEETDQ